MKDREIEGLRDDEIDTNKRLKDWETLQRIEIRDFKYIPPTRDEEIEGLRDDEIDTVKRLRDWGG